MELDQHDLHICKRPYTCECGIAALEPAESCPIHGIGEWPPRCWVCGKFMLHPGTGHTETREGDGE